MAKILLDYVLKCDVQEAIPPVDLGFLRKVILILKPKEGVDPTLLGQFNLYTSATDMTNALTDETDLDQFFVAGLNQVYATFVEDIADAVDIFNANKDKFFSVVIGSGFDLADLEDLPLITDFDGVTYVASDVETDLETQSVLTRRCAYYKSRANLYYAIGKLLSANTWSNNQYITLPNSDEVVDLASAENLFEKRISFGLTDDSYGHRLAFFAAGGIAIIAPYIQKELYLKLQSIALTFINTNRPQYTLVEAKKIEDQLMKLIQSYIDEKLLEVGTIEVKNNQSNFVMTANIVVSNPTALWRVLATIVQQ